MNSSIFRTLKDSLVNASNTNNRSTVELCITELASGNFPKAVDLSEELIKKDINDSVGWATKALSQAHLFDYNTNLFFLKSSLTSLDEFKAKTKLSAKEIIAVEAIFVTTFLDRTVTLVNERVEKIVELRQKAMAEKAKARAAAIGTAMSTYAGMQSKSNVGKILGFGGALAGATANAHFNSNAELLNNASKGVFGAAVANISMTVGSAMMLKKNLNELDNDIRNEATLTLQNWINTLAFLYQQVVENLLVYCIQIKKENVFTGSFREKSLNIATMPEAIQFVYLSKLLGIENSIPKFKEIEDSINCLQNINEKEITAAVTKMHLVAGGIVFCGIVLLNVTPILGCLFHIGLILYFYFMVKPMDKAGEVKKMINEIVNNIKKFKVTGDRIIVENMMSQEKVLNQ